ncbi:MAG: glycoside hydrolase family 2, partial [Hungatella sp.]
VGNGNEHGFATARDGETVVGFRELDFGFYGADEITIPIFALSDEAYPIEIWEGIPGEAGAELLTRVIYQKPSIWNVYQEETYSLGKRLKGITDLSFVLHQKIHMKGFSFKKINPAFERLEAIENKNVYGDSFEVTADGITNIGNNVTVEFGELDFGEVGIRKVIICGKSHIEKNAIHIRFKGEEGEQKQLVEFPYTCEETVQEFVLEPVRGIQNLTFVFLPGSQFDFSWFRFCL